MAAVALICMTMTCATFTACGGSDGDSSDGGNGSGQQTNTTKPTSVVLDVSLKQTTDMLKYCDISIEYNDGTGAKTESTTDTVWTKKITAKLPATITVKKTVTMKSDKDLSTDSSYVYGTAMYAYEYTPVDATGKATATAVTGQGQEKLRKHFGWHFADLVAKGSYTRILTLVFDADGKLQQETEKQAEN